MSDIPVFDSLSFYAYPQQQLDRYRELLRDFQKFYQAEPDFIARSPGRVNLVGEHLDYSYFSVLPLAIEVDTVIAVKVTDSNVIQLRNTHPRFPYCEIQIPQDGSNVVVNDEDPDWSDYFKCGVIVAYNFLHENGYDKPLKGLDVLVDGTVPTGGGLSSSASLICATSLAILKANNTPELLLTRENLVKMCTVSERYVGVNTGGMDQTASICGVKGNALYVSFQPHISATPVAFPQTEEPFEFVIANSLVVSNKQETAPRNYNLRVVEVHTAAQVLASLYGVEIPQDSGSLQSGTLKGFMDTYLTDESTQLQKLQTCLTLVEKSLGELKEYSVEEVSRAMGIPTDEYQGRYLTHSKVIFDKLKLYKRARHVYSEAARVLKLVELLKSSNNEIFLQKFGELMNESQKSCKEDYECSCIEIDEICEIAKLNGSYGSRLTGAGWGGCTVHLVPASKLKQVTSALVDQYYKKKFPNISDDELNEAIVVSRPAWGSSLFQSGFTPL